MNKKNISGSVKKELELAFKKLKQVIEDPVKSEILEERLAERHRNEQQIVRACVHLSPGSGQIYYQVQTSFLRH